MEKINSSITYQLLPIKDLMIGAYQRELDTNKVKEISAEFDINLVGTIIVSFRNGSYYILDGQHRIYESRKNGIKMLMCQVFHNLVYEQEAQMFLGFCNETHLPTYDKYNASIEGKYEIQLDIKRIVKKNRMEISRSIAKDKIKSVATLNTIYNKYGALHLDKTLMFIKATWDGESKSIGSNSIKGISEFIHIYGDDINLNIFAKQLSKYDPLKIAREADNDTNPIPKVAKTLNVIFKCYNLNLRSSRLINKHRRG